MWARRRIFPVQDVPLTSHPAALRTPLYDAQQQPPQHDGEAASVPAVTFTLEESAFNFIGGLQYTLVPSLGFKDAAALLAWALPSVWLEDDINTPADVKASRLSNVLRKHTILAACSQVEYFLVGTDNGHAFLMPLLPPHLLDALVAECGEAEVPGLVQRQKRDLESARSTRDGGATEARRCMPNASVPLNCIGRRLLHRHAREEPVTAMDHLGTLFASAATSGDTSVALSMFHPVPVGIACLPHASPVRSIKLWEGSSFTTSMDPRHCQVHGNAPQGASSPDALRRWHERVRAAEPTAIYLFSGDVAGAVRLWRIDVVTRAYSLQHVLVCSSNMTGMLSPLAPFAFEDNSKRVPSRDSDHAIHCLEVDERAGRVFAGTEGAVYVWGIDRLSWRGPDAVDCEDHSALAVQHPFCWDEPSRAPLPCALTPWLASQRAALPAESVMATEASMRTLEYRAARLANHHVWILPGATVQAEMARARDRHAGYRTTEKLSGWKPKYGRAVTGGAAVGVVSNNIKLGSTLADDDNQAAADRLTDTVVTVSFEGGELKNDFRVPLSCVIPVVYPVAFIRIPGTACFAVRVLAQRRRLVTSCADGRVCVWSYTFDPTDPSTPESYTPQLVTSTRQIHRGLGRHICVLRSPDIFITCSYDDGLVKEWHVYDEPELLLRCIRRFALTPFSSDSTGVNGGAERQEITEAFKNMLKSDYSKHSGADSAVAAGEYETDEEGDVVGGISCAAAYPAFGALFLVGAFESAIQTYSLAEVDGCEPPRNYIYNGHKTVRLPASMAEDVYHGL